MYERIPLMNWFKKILAQTQEPWQMSNKDFLNHHYTGYIQSRAYDQYNTSEGISYIKKENYKELYSTLNIDGNVVEIRRNITPLKYCKQDAEGWTNLRGPDGEIIYLTPEEIREKGYREIENDLAAFIGDRPIGFASNEWGATGVWVVQEFQRKGLGTYLLREFRKINPQMKELGQMTDAGINMTRKWHRSLVQDAINEGKNVPDHIRREFEEHQKVAPLVLPSPHSKPANNQ